MATESTISTFAFPTRIVFGTGALSRLPEEIGRLGLMRPLLVTDRGVVASGLVGRVLEAAATIGVAMPVFDGVSSNPTEQNVIDGLTCYEREKCDGIIGLGGGSPIDAAKAIRLRVTHKLPLEEYDDLLDGGTKITGNLPPLIAIATTAGTGTDVGRSTVLILKATERKTVIFSPYLIPSVAIVDPELTVSMPPHVTAGTGLDALTHNVEAYLSRGYHPMCDAIALEGMHLTSRYLVAAVRNGSDMRARTNMMMAAIMGAVAFQKGLGVVHSLAHPLSSVAGLHHGTANGILLPHALEFNRPASEDRIRDLAVAMELDVSRINVTDAATAMIERIRQLLKEVGVPNRLSHFGVTRHMIPAMAKKAMQDGCHLLNPRPCTEADMIMLYEHAL
jgi:4-hydroxybutyrate dehydrogenase